MHLVKTILKDVLQVNYHLIKQNIEDCIEDIIPKMYSYRLITRNTKTFEQSIKQFEAGIDLKTNIEDIQEHCRLFLDSINKRGPPTIIADKLAKEWNSEVYGQLAISFNLGREQTTTHNCKDHTNSVPMLHQKIEKLEEKLTMQFDWIAKNLIERQSQPGAPLSYESSIIIDVQPYWITKLPPERIHAVAINFFYTFISQHSTTLLKYHYIKGPFAIYYRLSHSMEEELTSIISSVEERVPFMKLVGVCKMNINGHIIEVNKQERFAFDSNLLEATRLGYSKAVEFLISLVTNIDYQNEQGQTALIIACEYQQILLVQMLLQANASVNLTMSDGSDALIIASLHGHYKLVKLLINNGANCHYQRKDGWTALMVACSSGKIKIIKLLLEENSDPNVQTLNGETAFMIACSNGHMNVVELLLKEKIDLNVKMNDGSTAFMLACANGHTHIAKLLLTEKVDPNIQGKNGLTAFILACRHGQIGVVKLLVKEKIDINFQMEDGWTAFMLACANGHIQVVQFLLKENVDISLKTKSEETALDIANRNGHIHIVELLSNN